MKPPRFEYVRAETVEEAVDAKATSDFAVVLAGGQSLIPTMNFRLATPDRLVDLQRVPGLDAITVQDGEVRVGAMVRQRDLELHQEVYDCNPLVREALQHVAHVVVRNRGTVGGSIAHADPAAELPTLLLALDGSVEVTGSGGPRRIAVKDLFLFHLTTSLEPDEVLTDVRFPVLPTGAGWAFEEFARRHGDYALAGACGWLQLSGGTCRDARLAACGVSSTPLRMKEAEDVVRGARLDRSTLEAAGEAARSVVSVDDDREASQSYRRDLLSGLVQRTLRRAADRAERNRD